MSASRSIAEISSPHNPVVKLVRSLGQRKHREETGLFVIEGLAFASRAITCGFQARHLLFVRRHGEDGRIEALIDDARSAGGRAAAVPRALLTWLTGKDNPQELLLVAEQRWATALPVHLRGDDVVLALDRIRDPRNLGAVMRTADAVGARLLILVGSCCDPYSPEAVRASAGSLFALPAMKAAAEPFLGLVQHWSGDVIGTALTAEQDFRHPHRGPVLLVMGNESDGLSPDLARACRRLVRIPMRPAVSSLNLAVAAALMLYELRLPSMAQDG